MNKRQLFSRVTGKGISRFRYRALSLVLLGVPFIMILSSMYTSAARIHSVITGVPILGSIAIASLMLTNRMFFDFDDNGTIMLINGLGYIKKSIHPETIVKLVITGAAIDGTAVGANKRLGYIDENGAFVHYPYLIIYQKDEQVEFGGADVRSYSGYACGFIIEGACKQVFQSVLNCTTCPIYVNNSILENSYDVRMNCNNERIIDRVHIV